MPKALTLTLATLRKKPLSTSWHTYVNAYLWKLL